MKLPFFILSIMALVAFLPTPVDACVCPYVLRPVCGTNGRTYENACVAGCEKVQIAYHHKCRPSSQPASKPTSKPASRPTSKPATAWKPNFPKKLADKKACFKGVIIWSQLVAREVAKYLHRNRLKKAIPNFKLERHNGVPVGKLWLQWLKAHPKNKFARFMVFTAYKFITTPPGQDGIYQYRMILGARFFCR